MAQDYLSMRGYTEQVKFHVLMTTHNRSSQTVQCLRALDMCLRRIGAEAHLYLVDAGSTDSTLEEVSGVWDRPLFVSSDSKETYWALGMERAEQMCWQSKLVEDSDFLLWLNDDVFLDEDALLRALVVVEERAHLKPSIFVGSLCSSDGSVTYGGLRRSRWNPMGIRMLEPTSASQDVDAFHGNFVIVPVPLAHYLKPIDGGFGHHMADIDYGIRNRKAGYSNVLLPGTYGICDTFLPDFRTFFDAWRHYLSIKGGGHWPTRRRFMAKHSSLPVIPTLVMMDVIHMARLFLFLRPKTGVVKAQSSQKAGAKNG